MQKPPGTGALIQTPPPQEFVPLWLALLVALIAIAAVIAWSRNRRGF